MIFKENISGDDLLDVMIESEAERVGQRMRKYRELKGISQAELGKMVELPADRIQKYENGVRKPKSPLLKQIAKALDVSPLALVDPTPSSYINTMYVLFEMEEKYNLVIDFSEADNSYFFKIDKQNELFDYIEPWYNRRHNADVQKGMMKVLDDKDKIDSDYTRWKSTYPHPLSEKTEIDMRRIEIELQIEMYKKELSKLDELESELNEND